MTRIQVACYSLLASAFILGGVLVSQVGDRAVPRAEAEMVIAQQQFTLMTGLTRNDEEALFVLDGRSQQLLVYRVKQRGGSWRMEPAGVMPMSQLFGGGRGGRGGGGGGMGGGR